MREDLAKWSESWRKRERRPDLVQSWLGNLGEDLVPFGTFFSFWEGESKTRSTECYHGPDSHECGSEEGLMRSSLAPKKFGRGMWGAKPNYYFFEECGHREASSNFFPRGPGLGGGAVNPFLNGGL